MTKFKKGDKVMYHGELATVFSVDGPAYLIDFSDGTRTSVYESDLVNADLEDDRGKNRTFGDS